MIKGSIIQENVTILSVYTSNKEQQKKREAETDR